MSDSPQLLVAWSSPWRDFFESLGPALGPSPPQLHVEAQVGLFPIRGILCALLLEFTAIATLIALPATLRPQTVEPAHSLQTHDVIYFSADELPRTQDLAGGSAGQRGAAGGTSLAHPSQTIKVARGEDLQARVIDAPDLKLPESKADISNLLAYKSETPAPPADPPVTNAPALTAPAMVVRAEDNIRKREPEEVAAPKVSLPKTSLPKLPESTVTALAPPPVSAPIKVAKNRAKLTVPAPAVPNVQLSQATMPELPQANVAVKAPPKPIQVARDRALASKQSSPEAPRIDGTSPSQAQLASIASAPVMTPALQRPPESKTVAVIVTPNPGSKPAAPKEAEKTTVAMTRNGSTNLGSGGTGGGSGMQPGKGLGSSESGSNSGATSIGTDKGTDFYARNGNSPNLGPGGTGSLSSGTPRAPGVSVSGGKTSITLPSFGGPPAPSPSSRSDIARNMGNGVTVVASPRAGGALNLYGALKGERVYTIYINTKIGTAVMQFADPTSVERGYTTDLTAPRVLQADVPSEIIDSAQHPKILISCDLDTNGAVRNARLLQSDGSEYGTKLLATVPTWKFTAATRGSQAVAVQAILGFGVDTR